MRTEDQVRDEARDILDFTDSETAQSGVGQITTLNQLGFPGNSKKPDGWYLPFDTNKTAIILETKAENIDIDTKKCVVEIREYGDIVMERYNIVIGILYNGKHTRVFRNNKPVEAPDELQAKEFYINRIKDEPLDKQKIYRLTAKINNNLHFNFGIKNLYSRMVFTASALVAERYSKYALMKGMDYSTLHNSIASNLNKSLEDSRRQNQKLEIIVEVYSAIRMNYTENQDAINEFIEDVKEISKAINSNHWAGEDVMGIFFNEFNRYKGKSEHGQVFTPDHITNFMYRLIDCNMNDYILDAACGSGAFLVKAMSNMIVEAGGVDTNKAKEIKSNRLFGIENDKEIFALACANMLIHKDGKTNLEHMDSRKIEAGEWINSKPITKVLMNPPFENKYGWDKIILNVLNNVKQGTMCAFILPDKKLEKASKKFREDLLENHRIKIIVKLPEEIFAEGITTSIFVIESGRPQEDSNIIAYNIKNDGLETVKNQGRQDIHNRWPEIEDYWIKAIQNGEEPKYNTKQVLDSNEHLSWQAPQKPFEISEEDFNKTLMDYLLFKQGIDATEFKDRVTEKVLYSSDVISSDDEVVISLEKGDGYGED
ncbi:HsdM family class I SAM-dependent methyltransferase [Anaerosalibacter sp. Marseille-P3206]|uniref:HsdM family class I SAM-dependent methyltransferase n=1 Tax=Anaerosalibacter sp. Marseille-P3206 TaxID=1871005 RepID=UPI0009878840|nr:N-6 DNA methylase [Anaerosalibacter sp. Marseille-P3206]